jgi:hypothetical protein
MQISEGCQHGLAQANERAGFGSHENERRPSNRETKLFSATDYAVRFAQVFAQILLLLAIIMLITRTPEFFDSVTGVEVRLTVEREGIASPPQDLRPDPANGDMSPTKEGW